MPPGVRTPEASSLKASLSYLPTVCIEVTAPAFHGLNVSFIYSFILSRGIFNLIQLFIEQFLTLFVCLCFRYISYPRTETNIFPRDLNLTALVEQQIPDPRWGAFAQSILERGVPTPRNGNKSDQAHPPIHPTKYTNSLQVGFLDFCLLEPRGR